MTQLKYGGSKKNTAARKKTTMLFVDYKVFFAQNIKLLTIYSVRM